MFFFLWFRDDRHELIDAWRQGVRFRELRSGAQAFLSVNQISEFAALVGSHGGHAYFGLPVHRLFSKR
jgi:hypothetical protein